jgi:phosphoribosylaminoimidazole carboxylase (NCAIR synthetase)
MNNEHFIKELKKELLLESEEQVLQLLQSLRKQIKNQQQKRQPITKNFLGRIMLHNLKKIKKEPKIEQKKRLLQLFRHKCFVKHYYKFLELANASWSAYKIEKYFKEVLNCPISRPTIVKILKALKNG